MADANQRTMRAARFDTATKTLTVTNVPVPQPGPGEVRVQVKACGICLSDAHLLDGSLQSPLPVVTPGHESSGVIDAVGVGVPRWTAGQRVAMAGGKPCGRCARCSNGQPAECLDFHIMGFHYDGAWAEYVVVPYFVLSAIPDHLPFEQAAILADAVATPYAGLVETAQLRPAQSVGLWGIGGLGVHAVQIARMMGATPILAFDTNEAARKRALEFGADVALDPRAPDVRKQVLQHTNGMGLDVAVDLVGANVVLAQASMSLGRNGRAVMVGLSPEPIQLGAGVNFGVRSQALLGHLGYEKKHLDQLVALVGGKRLDVSRSVTATLPLEDVAKGVERLVSKEGNPIRLVITP
ncbi:zinc-binding dehydrogenase [Myxococcus sp. MISCRS1]|uniref:zinc-binding dehydrogenase n=1 Tax=Myxococcus sp. MISCRS1 TaxID=2996786 RepID=UPI0022707F18|nr:zinc-binding dehydrogenase [Myxococcus sp. MISCRS1]MCY0998978.1 zinc-binding dehydrogenase [Myxococcus sp. MISCRS1]